MGNGERGWETDDGESTSVDDVVVVEVVDGFEDLADGLGGIFLCELALLANPIE